MAERKRMGSMGKLSDFGKTNAPVQSEKQPLEQQPVVKEQPPAVEEPPQPEPPSKTIEAPATSPKPEDRLTTVNIKIYRSQHEWLNDTARQVRDNNETPVPAGDRVYPQHLIQTAIELLRSADVDWTQVKNTEDLKRFINL
ncbi:hypothetical protein H6G00_00400 [Leptolyngbya sp. FACHB-541]|uniref:hypothetical protein n=1 Tax=Leptolyngbya sp. FACHB-541 TaxID=2692810 RepID=UPI001687543C|nr:hypothetical protein [Leptolyngbya sp. FACHB-541]MBD1995089.1 hypothetical protein [Leptolyngbya sp. FACHB-541]